MKEGMKHCSALCAKCGEFFETFEAFLKKAHNKTIDLHKECDPNSHHGHGPEEHHGPHHHEGHHEGPGPQDFAPITGGSPGSDEFGAPAGTYDPATVGTDPAGVDTGAAFPAGTFPAEETATADPAGQDPAGVDHEPLPAAKKVGMGKKHIMKKYLLAKKVQHAAFVKKHMYRPSSK